MAKLERFDRAPAPPGTARRRTILNVLIIDDNEMTRGVLRSILNQGGYRIVGEAGSGKAGLEQAANLEPDLVCLDIMLPDISGIEVLKEITGHLPKTLVLMVTGKRDLATVKECLGSGAKGFIVKPFNAATVLNVIRDAVLRAAETGTPDQPGLS
jgi:two-component system chemotaxis response regulator CheY